MRRLIAGDAGWMVRGEEKGAGGVCVSWGACGFVSWRGIWEQVAWGTSIVIIILWVGR